MDGVNTGGVSGLKVDGVKVDGVSEQGMNDGESGLRVRGGQSWNRVDGCGPGEP